MNTRKILASLVLLSLPFTLSSCSDNEPTVVQPTSTPDVDVVTTPTHTPTSPKTSKPTKKDIQREVVFNFANALSDTQLDDVAYTNNIKQYIEEGCYNSVLEDYGISNFRPLAPKRQNIRVDSIVYRNKDNYYQYFSVYYADGLELYVSVKRVSNKVCGVSSGNRNTQ